MKKKYISNAKAKSKLIQGIKQKISQLYKELYEHELKKNNNHDNN